MSAPRVPEPMTSVAALVMTSAAATAPNARGGTKAARRSSEENHVTWLAAWPTPIHDAARPTLRALTSGAGSMRWS